MLSQMKIQLREILHPEMYIRKVIKSNQKKKKEHEYTTTIIVVLFVELWYQTYGANKLTMRILES